LPVPNVINPNYRIGYVRNVVITTAKLLLLKPNKNGLGKKQGFVNPCFFVFLPYLDYGKKR